METHSEPVYVSLEFTPNPNTLKYSVNRTLIPGGALSYRSLEEAKGKSELAEELLAIKGIEAVMLGRDFVTITKAEHGDWDFVHKSASGTVENFLTSVRPVVTGEVLKAAGLVGGAGGENSAVTQKIIDFLEREIRPAVAQDGGDIAFERYEAGIVYVTLKGSCHGCPSSTMTLKMGIESRLKAMIPEIQEVVAL